MCGRTVCNLKPDVIQRRCQFINKKGNKCNPKLKQLPNGANSVESYNISPSQTTMILLCETSNTEEYSDNRIIQPMRWGLIPSYFKDEIKDFKLSTHNAKLETILEKLTFKNSLNKGHRCVCIMEGFYEWTSNKKQPYFIKPLADESLLYVAAIFDVLDTKDGPLYSYSIITEGSHGRISAIHHRSPVILHDSDEVEMWLDSKNSSSQTVVKYLLNRRWIDDDLDIYPVCNFVNNSANDGPRCTVKMDLTKSNSHESTPLTRWLVKEAHDVKEPSNKKYDPKHSIVKNDFHECVISYADGE